MTAGVGGLVLSRDSGVLRPDPRRVIAKLFIPGHEHLIQGQSRATPVIERILAMTPEAAASALADTMNRYAHRHDDLSGLFDEHFTLVAHRVGATDDLPEVIRLLVGAYFTHEYSIEAAALFNPSIVAHPDQAGVREGELRVVLSLRAVGEGHLSSIEFRTGVVGADGRLRLDEPHRYPVVGRPDKARFDRSLFHSTLAGLGDDGEDAAFVLDALPESFTGAELEIAMAVLHEQKLTRRTADITIQHLRWVASCNYAVRFAVETELSQRVLTPTAPTESHGMEDARFVRFVDDDGTVTYYATYTAFDGTSVVPQLLETGDFTTFRASPLTGPGAANKGMAMFPRRVGGRYLALSRWDRENNSLCSSADARVWGDAVTVQTPRYPWELIQIGNCGSPIETAAGWLVLTHGVGPMRGYAIGAILLDLDDPSRLIGQLSEPLLTPTGAERDGYVPNVTYTCGALAHDDRLTVPYGGADSSVGVAVIDLPALLERLTENPGRAA